MENDAPVIYGLEFQVCFELVLLVIMVILYLDLDLDMKMSAAFETVDHEILPCRPEVSFGVSGQACKWLSSFLTDRLQFVGFGGSISTQQRLLCGVPQGSVLGSLVFALYSADFIQIAAKHEVCIHAYADDLQPHFTLVNYFIYCTLYMQLY